MVSLIGPHNLNSELKNNHSFETFSHDLFMFDMKNLREMHKNPDQITKYQNRETSDSFNPFSIKIRLERKS